MTDEAMPPRAKRASSLTLGAGALGFWGVASGAFAAHALRAWAATLSDGVERLAWWETGSRYVLVHAGVALALAFEGSRRARGAGWALVVGSVVFGATLQAMTLGAPRWFGAITPVGGMLLLVGWLLAASLAWRRG